MQETGTQRGGDTVVKWLAASEQFPELRALGELRALTTVYYPVALLRMKLEEYSFEDFNAIERSMLRFYACGITDADGLCKWMALPSLRYVQERLALLKAEGLIENGQLTSLGEESLRIDRKKILFDAEQIFLADGITGLLFPQAYQIRETQLTDRQSTAGLLPHLAHSESIAFSTIQEAIEGPEKIRDYKRYRNSVLNVNVQQVKSVRVADVKYLKALLIWPACSRSPLMLFPYHERSKPGHRRHCDMPLFLPESLSERLPELSKLAEGLPDSQLSALIKLYGLIMDDQAQQDLDGVSGWLKENTVFHTASVDIRSDRIMVQVQCPDDTQMLSALELEICASLGAYTAIPVEVEMQLRGEGARLFRKRLSIWPYTSDPTEEVRQLSSLWSEYGRKICKDAPMTLKNAIDFIRKKQRREDA